MHAGVNTESLSHPLMTHWYHNKQINWQRETQHTQRAWVYTFLYFLMQGESFGLRVRNLMNLIYKHNIKKTGVFEELCFLGRIMMLSGEPHILLAPSCALWERQAR